MKNNFINVALFLLILSAAQLMAAREQSVTWKDLLKDKEKILNANEFTIVNKQYYSFISGRAPTISAQEIVSIAIEENNQQLIDVVDMHDERISMLPSSPQKQSFVAPEYNSGLPSASKMRMGIWLKLKKMILALDELGPLFGYKPKTISIKIFEGLRDLETQKRLFNNKCNEIKKDNPAMSDNDIEFEAAKWVSPCKNNVPVHSTGAAIDIRLWNTETNNFLDLGSFGVIWGTNHAAPTFSENITKEQKVNRLYLLLAAAQAGLVNYVYEYWHYSDGDRYASYWKENDIQKRKAVYGPVN